MAIIILKVLYVLWYMRWILVRRAVSVAIQRTRGTVHHFQRCVPVLGYGILELGYARLHYMNGVCIMEAYWLYLAQNSGDAVQFKYRQILHHSCHKFL